MDGECPVWDSGREPRFVRLFLRAKLLPGDLEDEINYEKMYYPPGSDGCTWRALFSDVVRGSELQGENIQPNFHVHDGQFECHLW